MNKKLFAVLSLALLIPAAAAMAADKTDMPCKKTYVAAFDADKNGVVTDQERQAGRQARFAEMDADKNGKLSKEEFVKGHEQWAAKTDKNGDGLVEVAEYTLFFCGEEPVKDVKGKHKAAKKSYAKCFEYRSRLFALMDENKDGKVSPEERAKFNEAAFAKMDKNADGFIEIDELYEVELAPAEPCKCGKGDGKCKCAKGGKPCKKDVKGGKMCPHAQKAAEAASAAPATK